ncbi:MAG: hypothetical protein ACUZ8N_09285 [Candidatus Scalindua sp.]
MGRGSNWFKYKIDPPDAKFINKDITTIDTDQGYENYELIYTGKDKQALHITYREYSPEDLARTAFFQNLTYPSDAEVIRFKDYKILVDDATSESITFTVAEDGGKELKNTTLSQDIADRKDTPKNNKPSKNTSNKSATNKTTNERKTELQISLRNKQVGKGTIFYGKTNLPDGTKLGINLVKNGKGCGQDFDIFISGGEFNSAPFTNHGNPLSGTYNVELFTVFNKLWQAKNILVLLENYDSENITVGEIGWKKLAINKTFNFLSPDGVEQQQYIKKKTDKIVEMKSYLQKLEGFHIELMDTETLQQFNGMIRDWNIRLDSTRNEFGSQFGETMGEYKGHCPQAHLYIGIGYGTLASQTWLDQKSFLEGRMSKANMIQSNIEVNEYINTARDHLEICMDEINN